MKILSWLCYYTSFATQATLEAVKVFSRFFNNRPRTATELVLEQTHLVIFFIYPKMKPKINIIDLRLLEISLSAVVFTIIKIASYYIIFGWKYGKSSSKIWHSVVATRLTLGLANLRYPTQLLMCYILYARHYNLLLITNHS